MRRLISLIVLLFAMLAVSSAMAQRPDIFVTPVPNNPFTGTINVERFRVATDGITVKLRTVRNIGRDGRGRIFNEARTLVAASSDESPQLLSVLIYDPETRLSTTVNNYNHSFRRGTVNRPPEMVPPSFLSASSGLNTLPQNQFTREEDLGNKVMEGLPVHGVRQSQTIPGKDGVKATVITDEYWYSEDLRINLVIKHDDPRQGGVTMTVTGINRSEPDAARFEIPEGFTQAGVEKQTKH
jgi:hypothetical protein